MSRCKNASVELFWATYEEAFLTNKSENIAIFTHSVQLSYGALGVILNIIFMALILTDKTMRVEMSYYLTLFLAWTDILISGGIVMADSALFLAFYHVREVRRPILMTCRLWASFSTLVCCSTSLHVPAIAIDRYMLISRPLHYHTMMNGYMMALLLGSVWLLSVCIAMVPLKFSFSKPCIDPEVPVDSASQRNQYKMTGQSIHLHPLRLCDLAVGPADAIPAVTMAMLLPAIMLVVACCMMYNVSYVHKKSVSYKVVLGKIRSHVEQLSIKRSSPKTGSENVPTGNMDMSQPGVTFSIKRLEPVSSASFGPESSVDLPNPKHKYPSSGRTSLQAVKERVSRVQRYVVSRLRGSITTQNKALRILVLLVGTHLLAWVPVGIHTIVVFIFPQYGTEYLGQRVLKAAQFKSCVNPIIFGMSDKRLLDGLKALFKPVKPAKQVRVSNISDQVSEHEV